MKQLSAYPEWTPLTLDYQDELEQILNKTTSGISEFTFAGLYLFRNTYTYKFCLAKNGSLLLQGQRDGKTFFSTPDTLPDQEGLKILLGEFDFWKNLSKDQVQELGSFAQEHSYIINPDRKNWDYLYDCTEMSELAGKKFHKKRNLIHQFHESYNYTSEPLVFENAKDAEKILQIWSDLHQEKGDTKSAEEGLVLMERLKLQGKLFRVNGEPVGYTLGEEIGSTGTFVIHFEKANPAYKGIYQVIFQDFACELRGKYQLINREQDLDDPGLRQAKETYRPMGFIEKFTLSR